MSCSAAPLICIPHFFYNADLLHKQAGTLSGKTGSGPRHAEIEEAQRLGIPIRQIGELEIKQEALPAEMEQSEAPGQSMGMA